ncbi:MAG TPA: hypothetical protein PKK91_04905 [bacterium]|nr:hypothetical protein [bacterium]HRV04696.1 hypothetical protein [Candidatus Ratteibacteria bacterium]
MRLLSFNPDKPDYKRILSFLLFFIFGFSFQLFSAERTTSQKTSIILQKNIFFSPLEKKQEKPGLPVFISQIPQPQSLDKTYTLIGTFIFIDEREKTTAVLKEISTNKMLFLKNGDVVAGNRIIEIKDDGVVFESAFGERFTLTQSGIKSSQPQGQSFYFRVNLKTAIETILSHPEVLSSIKITSIDKDTHGFKVEDIEPGSIFELCGLSPNDIIIQIDEILLKTPDDAIFAYKRILQTGKKFTTIKILRNKKQMNLVYILE